MLHPIILYDGVCGLCNRLNQFVLRRDHEGSFRFASLQSPLAARILARHGANPQDLDTVYVVLNSGEANEALLAKSDAFLLFTKEIGGIWSIARLVKIIPRPIRNWLYDFVARHRYQVFGKYETCMLPDPRHKDKFIEG